LTKYFFVIPSEVEGSLAFKKSKARDSSARSSSVGMTKRGLSTI
jgi:hypothetical protein